MLLIDPPVWFVNEQNYLFLLLCGAPLFFWYTGDCSQRTVESFQRQTWLSFKWCFTFLSLVIVALRPTQRKPVTWYEKIRKSPFHEF